MARQGLPKKYAKMGFARGWKAYKASKKSRKGPSTKRRSTSNPAKTRTRTVYKKAAPTKRRRRRNVPGLLAIKGRDAGTRAANAAMMTGVGIIGAVGSAIGVNMLPMRTPQAKALTQFLLGLAVLSLVPKKQQLLKIAGTGSTLAGGLALTKLALPQFSPLLAGDFRTGKRQIRPLQVYQKPTSKLGVNANFASPPSMGVNADFSLAGNSRRASKYKTSANY